MEICIVHRGGDSDVDYIINTISERYNLIKIELNINDIKDFVNKNINEFITSISLADYIKIKRYLKNFFTFYIDCSQEKIAKNLLKEGRTLDEINNQIEFEESVRWSNDLFTFKIMNNNILSRDRIADMVYEACYGKQLLDNKSRRIVMSQLKVKKDELLFAKTKSNAIIPSKRDEDGCYDIYCCFDENEIRIEPHEIKLIDSGIATAFDKKWRLAIRERGSNSKSGLITMSGQVDSGYRGSIFISLYNTNNIPVIITKSVDKLEKTKEYIRVPYTKAVAQFAMEEVPVLIKKEVDYETLKKIYSERGIGSLGSSEK